MLDGLELKILNESEFSVLYKKYVKADFPVGERRPLFMMKKRIKAGSYICYALLSGEEISAYAIIISHKESNCLMLELFAVNKSIRGKGVGSDFLQSLKEQLKADGILLECENPDFAKTEEERVLRQKRIAFYKKNGGVLTDFAVKAFGVEYLVMFLPLKSVLPPEDIDREFRRFYSTSVPAFLSRIFVKTRRLH